MFFVIKLHNIVGCYHKTFYNANCILTLVIFSYIKNCVLIEGFLKSTSKLTIVIKRKQEYNHNTSSGNASSININAIARILPTPAVNTVGLLARNERLKRELKTIDVVIINIVISY